MGTKFPGVSITGYNSSPPSDDGSINASNQIFWATIKGKLSDPLNTFSTAINSALLTALDATDTTTSTNYTTVAADNGKPIEVTGTTTISLGTATSMGNGYGPTILNTGVGVVTVALITGTDTLDGTVNGTKSLNPGQGYSFVVNAAATGYITKSTSVLITGLGMSGTSKTSNYNAAAGDTFPHDTSGGAFTVTLPASPNVGDSPILIHDLAGTFATTNLTVGRNGNKIMGLAANMICDINNFSGWLVWSGSTYGWRVL